MANNQAKRPAGVRYSKMIDPYADLRATGTTDRPSSNLTGNPMKKRNAGNDGGHRIPAEHNPKPYTDEQWRNL